MVILNLNCNVFSAIFKNCQFEAFFTGKRKLESKISYFQNFVYCEKRLKLAILKNSTEDISIEFSISKKNYH